MHPHLHVTQCLRGIVAAEFPFVLTAEIPLASVDLSIAVDLRGTWLCMKHEIEAMLSRGGGAIVNVSSVNGFSSSPKAAMHSATIHDMNGLNTAAAREYIAKGIRINSVCPGAIETGSAALPDLRLNKLRLITPISPCACPQHTLVAPMKSRRKLYGFVRMPRRMWSAIIW